MPDDVPWVVTAPCPQTKQGIGCPVCRRTQEAIIDSEHRLWGRQCGQNWALHSSTQPKGLCWRLVTKKNFFKYSVVLKKVKQGKWCEVTCALPGTSYWAIPEKGSWVIKSTGATVGNGMFKSSLHHLLAIGKLSNNSKSLYFSSSKYVPMICALRLTELLGECHELMLRMCSRHKSLVAHKRW